MWLICGNLIAILITTGSGLPNNLFGFLNGSRSQNIDDGINTLVGFDQNNTHSMELISSLGLINEVPKCKSFKQNKI